MGRKHVLIIAGRYEKIRNVCKFVAEGAEKAGLDETAIFHVELACDEACTNVIEHAYGGEDLGDIEVSWQIDGDQFTITVHDTGRSFDPAGVPAPTLPGTAPEDPVEQMQTGGLGLHFMRRLMDEVRFSFEGDKGNTLTMIKRIPEE